MTPIHLVCFSIHPIQLEHSRNEDEDVVGGGHPILAMSPTIFLIGDGPLVKAFEFDNSEWTCKSIFSGHYDHITSLTKVNESLFVSTSMVNTSVHYTNAKLWDLNNNSECLFTFLGHSESIHSSVYLEEEKEIATGDKNGNIAVWSIARYLEEENQEGNEETQGIVISAAQDHYTSNNNNGDQNPNTAEP